MGAAAHADAERSVKGKIHHINEDHERTVPSQRVLNVVGTDRHVGSIDVESKLIQIGVKILPALVWVRYARVAGINATGEFTDRVSRFRSKRGKHCDACDPTDRILTLLNHIDVKVEVPHDAPSSLRGVACGGIAKYDVTPARRYRLRWLGTQRLCPEISFLISKVANQSVPMTAVPIVRWG